MLKYVNHDIVFQEFPDEVTLAVNLALCPNGCAGCHSPYLKEDVGEELSADRLLSLVGDYAGEITCVGLMGGDNDPAAVAALLSEVKKAFPAIHTGWYSGRQELPANFRSQAFDYVKVGPYVAALGPLTSRTTNQRLYRFAANGEREDVTHRFWRK